MNHVGFMTSQRATNRLMSCKTCELSSYKKGKLFCSIHIQRTDVLSRLVTNFLSGVKQTGCP